MEDVPVRIGGWPPFTPPPPYELTDSTGFYEFPNSLPFSSSFTIVPEFDSAPLNGITTFDLVLISKHILGITPLASPYKIIAADANRSNSLTTLDIVELRKLILGIYQELPSSDSWRFVPNSYVFPNPMNPFQESIPAEISIAGIFSNISNGDFVGIKVGDVNDTAVPHTKAPSDERNAGTLHFNISKSGHETLQAGEVFEVSFKSETDMLACQFTLNLNGLEVLEILPGSNVTLEHFGLFPGDNALTMAWEKGGVAAFTLKCKALETGNLREMLSIGSRITKAEGYQENVLHQVNRFDLALRFPDMGTFALFQNHPNPFVGATEIAFNLPEASEATLKVFDANGRVLFTQTGNYERGTHTITLEKSALDALGVLYYQLETPTHSAMRKMVKI